MTVRSQGQARMPRREFAERTNRVPLNRQLTYASSSTNLLTILCISGSNLNATLARLNVEYGLLGRPQTPRFAALTFIAILWTETWPRLMTIENKQFNSDPV
jgi:hypothetical protein